MLDNVLTHWMSKCNKNTQQNHTTHSTINIKCMKRKLAKTLNEIKSSFGTWESPVGVNLKFRDGKCNICYFGNQNLVFYLSCETFPYF